MTMHDQGISNKQDLEPPALADRRLTHQFMVEAAHQRRLSHVTHHHSWQARPESETGLQRSELRG
jgi:hypothetical protein